MSKAEKTKKSEDNVQQEDNKKTKSNKKSKPSVRKNFVRNHLKVCTLPRLTSG
jgi:hypothetical protein